MAECIIVGSGNGNGEQLGIYPVGINGRPTGDVTVPEGVESLYKYIFYGDTAVTSIKLPNTLTSIDAQACLDCSNLIKINLPESLTNLGTEALSNTAIAEIVIPPNVNIPNECFVTCSKLETVEIKGSGVKTIGDYAFDRCSSLKKITFSDEITGFILNQRAFINCSSITDEYINPIISNIDSLGEYAFEGCKSLVSVTPEYTWTAMFQACTGIKTAHIKRATSSGTTGNYAFLNCSSLESVIYDEEAKTNLITIGQHCFEGCTSLKTYELPPNITSIEDYAFKGCTNLSNVIIDENTKFILNDYAFSNCNSLTDEMVNNIVTHASEVSTYIFSKCMGLKNINIANCGSYMFFDCSNLETAVINKQGASGNSVFEGCTSLSEVEFKDGLTTIEKLIFYNCTSLKKITLPSSITTATNSSLTATSNSYYFLRNCTALEECVVGEDWNMSLRLNVSSNLTVDGMVNLMNNLKDLTGETAKTLTLGETNLTKLTDEQKAIAINKNWTLA